MKLNRDGFIYKVAYGYRDYEPAQTNLCRFFWSFLVSLLVVWPFIIFVFFPVAFILLALGFVLSSLFAARPAVLKHDNEKELFVSYSHWPKWHGHNVPPILVGVSAALVYLVYLAGTHLYAARLTILALLVRDRIVITVLMVILAVWLVWAIRFLQRAGVFSLLGAYLKAKKERVCPTIMFVKKE